MDTISTLGSLMGLGLVSGIRLYSTVLVVGLGIRLGLLHPAQPLQGLDVLASTPILIVAGIAYVLEFLADKIPLVDTAWDMVHTFLRPVGAAVLAATALGPIDPALKVGAILLAGSIALSGHSAKAGTRALINQSPEPFTNIGASLGEDGLVLGGVWLAISHPIVALVLVLVAAGLVIWLVPKIFRLLRRQLERLRRFLNGPAAQRQPAAEAREPAGR